MTPELQIFIAQNATIILGGFVLCIITAVTYFDL